MIDINETAAGVNRFKALLRKPHSLEIRVLLMTLDGAVKKELTTMFLDGQVTVDSTAEVTRGLDISFIDPLGKIEIEPDSPSSTSVFIADMIRVVYVIRDPFAKEIFSCSVFTGPVVSVSRTDMFLDVKAVGKESLGLNNVWAAKTFKKGQSRTDVIKHILSDLMGENKMHIPARPAKLGSDLKIRQDDAPWKVASRLAASMNCQLFYDGRGIAVMRARSVKPVHVVDETWSHEPPQVAYDMTAVVNAIRVTGGKPKKAKKKVSAIAVAQRTHPLSPWRLGRNGVPRFIWISVEDDSLRTDAECQELADSMLEQGLASGVTYAADGIMDPRLEELDCVKLSVGSINVQAPIKQFVIPLNAGEDGSYGYVKRIKPKGGAKMIKRHKSKHKHKSHKNPQNGKHRTDGKWEEA